MARTGNTTSRTAGVPPWLRLTTFSLALAGLGVSSYLTNAHFTKTPLVCPVNAVENCLKVTTSPQSYVFGIPVACSGWRSTCSWWRS
jgi:uncharacterized membrane protein